MHGGQWLWRRKKHARHPRLPLPHCLGGASARRLLSQRLVIAHSLKPPGLVQFHCRVRRLIWRAQLRPLAGTATVLSRRKVPLTTSATSAASTSASCRSRERTSPPHSGASARTGSSRATGSRRKCLADMPEERTNSQSPRAAGGLVEGRSSTEGGRKEGGVWLAKLSTGLAEKLIVREGLLNPLVGADIVLGSREGKGRRWSSIVHIFKHGSYNFSS